MYFPYLRGRQFELIALREFAEETYQQDQKVIPIIEPVKQSMNSLKIAISKFKSFDFSFSLILNPKVGELVGRQAIFDELSEDLDGADWKPAFIVTPTNSEAIHAYLSETDLSDVILIVDSSVDLTSEKVRALLGDQKIEFLISDLQRINRKLKGIDKSLVKLSDSFQKQDKNADYKEKGAELFSEEHLFYAEEGFTGYSDYTALSSEFTEGGTSPYAVVIHLTYLNSEQEIWIRHFTSESNDGQENVQGKFKEAVEKAVYFLDGADIHTVATEELRKYFREEKYPGLGMIKKLSIKNHLELVHTIL